MAYRLRKREGIATGARRIVHAELARAIDELEGRRSGHTGTAVQRDPAPVRATALRVRRAA
jgi:hypothetical protein